MTVCVKAWQTGFPIRSEYKNRTPMRAKSKHATNSGELFRTTYSTILFRNIFYKALYEVYKDFSCVKEFSVNYSFVSLYF